MPDLISVEEALAYVLAQAPEPRPAPLALDEAAGLVLAESVCAREDHPPFPRSRVDGYAVRSRDVPAGGALLTVGFEVAAGSHADRAVVSGEAARVFTGAPVPAGADVVVMQERCERDGDLVRVPGPQESGQNVTPQAVECAAGDPVAAPGDIVTPALAGVLASVGAARVSVYGAPTARVLATGDELVAIDADPGPGQIRNSNAIALVTALRRLGATVTRHDRVGDDRGELLAAVEATLEADIAVITGGVSVGDYDLVPEALERAGVTSVFHGVRLQPGKPLWFGFRGRTLVFGLPGNPVSALVNAELFIAPVLRRLRGLPPVGNAGTAARLGAATRGGTWRRRYEPVKLSRTADGGLIATPVRYRGSGDIFGFARADALLVVPEGAPAGEPGDPCEVVPLRSAASDRAAL